jgi:hypothetical protein
MAALRTGRRRRPDHQAPAEAEPEAGDGSVTSVRPDPVRGPVGEDPTALLASARDARWHEPDLSLVLADRAAKAADAPGMSAVRLDAEVVALTALAALTRDAAAVQRGVPALIAAVGLGDQALAIRISVQLGRACAGVGEPDLGLTVLAPVLAETRIEPAVRSAALVSAAACLARTTRQVEELQVLQEAEYLLVPAGASAGAPLPAPAQAEADGVARALVVAALSGYHRRAGNPAAALATAERGIALLGGQLAGERDSAVVAAALADLRVHALLDLGDRQAAVAVAREQLRQPVRPSGAAPACALRLGLAHRVHLAAHEYTSAARLLEDVAGLARRHGLDGPLAEALFGLADIHEARGEVVDALRRLRSAQVAYWRRERDVTDARLLLARVLGQGVSPLHRLTAPPVPLTPATRVTATIPPAALRGGTPAAIAQPSPAAPAVPAPAVSTPAVPTPVVSTPAVSTPAVSTPAGSAPAAAPAAGAEPVVAVVPVVAPPVSVSPRAGTATQPAPAPPAPAPPAPGPPVAQPTGPTSPPTQLAVPVPASPAGPAPATAPVSRPLTTSAATVPAPPAEPTPTGTGRPGSPERAEPVGVTPSATPAAGPVTPAPPPQAAAASVAPAPPEEARAEASGTGAAEGPQAAAQVGGAPAVPGGVAATPVSPSAPGASAAAPMTPAAARPHSAEAHPHSAAGPGSAPAVSGAPVPGSMPPPVVESPGSAVTGRPVRSGGSTPESVAPKPPPGSAQPPSAEPASPEADHAPSADRRAARPLPENQTDPEPDAADDGSFGLIDELLGDRPGYPAPQIQASPPNRRRLVPGPFRRGDNGGLRPSGMPDRSALDAARPAGPGQTARPPGPPPPGSPPSGTGAAAPQTAAGRPTDPAPDATPAATPGRHGAPGNHRGPEPDGSHDLRPDPPTSHERPPASGPNAADPTAASGDRATPEGSTHRREPTGADPDTARHPSPTGTAGPTDAPQLTHSGGHASDDHDTGEDPPGEDACTTAGDRKAEPVADGPQDPPSPQPGGAASEDTGAAEQGPTDPVPAVTTPPAGRPAMAEKPEPGQTPATTDYRVSTDETLADQQADDEALADQAAAGRLRGARRRSWRGRDGDDPDGDTAEDEPMPPAQPRKAARISLIRFGAGATARADRRDQLPDREPGTPTGRADQPPGDGNDAIASIHPTGQSSRATVADDLSRGAHDGALRSPGDPDRSSSRPDTARPHPDQ